MGNGGIIGVTNRAIGLSAPGVWTVKEVFYARYSNEWPGSLTDDPSLIEYVMSNAVGGIQGAVFQDVNFLHPVGNTEGRFTVNSATDTFTITTSGFPEGHLLAVNDEVFFEEATAGDLPPPIVPGVSYYIQSVPTATTFKVSETIGGSAVSIIANGQENVSRKIFKRPGASDPKIDIEIYHYSAAVFPSGLTITNDTQVGEDIDADFRLTCVVVDKNLTIDTGGTLRITNNRRRFGFMIASRENVQIGPGAWTIPMFQNVTPPGPQQRGHPQYRRWQVSKEGPFANRFLVAGGNGGNGSQKTGEPTNPLPSSPGPGGGGGSAFGGQSGFPNGAGTLGGGGVPSSWFQGVDPVFFQPIIVPVPGGGPAGGLPGANNTMRGYAMVVGSNVTIPGPSPTVRISTVGANGSPHPSHGGGGGGGGTVYIIHSGSYTNNGTISVAGGTGGTGGSSSPGGAGSIVTIPVSGV